MEDIVQIPVPLPHIRSVNTWLLRGDPLTLVDTGPHADDALAALDAGLRARRRPDRGRGARPADPSPPGPHGPGRDHRRPLGRHGGRARSCRRLRRALRGALRSRSSVLARPDAPPRRAGCRHRRQRDVLGLHPPVVRCLAHRRPPERRRSDPGRRARPARRGPAGPQHHRHAVRRRPRQPGLRRRPPAGLHIVEHGDLPGGRARWDAPARTGGVPRQPAADGGDAPGPAVERPRRPDHRARRARRGALRPARAPMRANPEGARGRPCHRVRDHPAAVVAAHGGRAAPAGGLGGAGPPRPAARRGRRHRAGDRRRLAPRPRRLRAGRRRPTAPATHRQGFRFRDPRNHEPPGGGGHARTSRHAHRRC